MKLALPGPRYVLVLLMGIVLSVAVLNSYSTPTTSAASPGIVQQCNKRFFFGLKPWYAYLGKELATGNDAQGHKKCDVKCFNVTNTGHEPNECGQYNSDIPFVLLAIVDDLLIIAAIAAIGYVVYGAFQFVASQGDSEATVRARNTVINALVGLALTTVSITIVSFLGKRLG